MGLTTIVGTTPGRENWLAQCLVSLFGRDVLVVSLEDGFELGKIKWVYDHTDLDRFLFLQDSVEVLSQGFWEYLNAFDGSASLLCEPMRYGSYMGIYERKVLDLLEWPTVETKLDSIAQEVGWTQDYVRAAGDVPTIFRDLKDSNGYEKEHFGRNNLVLENQYFRKYKGTWL